jgi:hypothetical protein
VWIGDIDISYTLIDAHRDGTLVIFVGAGASLDPPSSLPTFVDLAKGVAAAARAPFDPDRNPDVFLGDLDKDGIPVRDLVVNLLSGPSSKPNHLHGAIARLAGTGGAVRVVTTNYDQHLTSALVADGAAPTEYFAPALPMGDDFEGVVHLHGSLSQASRHLIVTDADFGHAYLRHAWAARFLERMYSKYTVLFIGYSHDDVVMTYMARALGDSAKRYVLTSNPSGDQWRRLDITPIGYRVVGGSHQALVDTVVGWADRAGEGLLEHRARLEALLSGVPSEIPADKWFLEWSIASPVNVHLFTELARGVVWLDWAATQPAFKELFATTAAYTDETNALAYWFARNFVMSEEHTGRALAVVRNAGGRLSAPTANAIGHVLHQAAKPLPPWAHPWLVLLTQSDPAAVDDWIEYALVSCTLPDQADIALVLFDFLTEPRAAFGYSFSQDRVSFSVVMHGSEHWLTEVWTSTFKPHIADVAPKLLPSLERHLRHAHRILTSTGAGGDALDPQSFSRSAIEPHSQDRHRDPIDVVIDAARDCLEALLDTGDPSALTYLSTWARSDVPLLRRLALHGWAHRDDVNADAKLRWITEHPLWSDVHVHHELFALLASALPTASQDAVIGVIASVPDPKALDLSESDPDLARSAAYQRFNVLQWINQHAPHVTQAGTAVEEVLAEHDFAVRTHPDLHSHIEIGHVGPQPPMTVEELAAALAEDPVAAIATLRTFEKVTRPFEGPTWEDARGVVHDLTRTEPSAGFQVLDAPGVTQDLVRTVIDAWSEASPDSQTASEIIQRLNAEDRSFPGREVAQLLGQFGRGDEPRYEWPSVDGAKTLARATWNALPGKEPTDDDDWLQRALNHPAGWLARFWIDAVGAAWRGAKEHWQGLPADLASDLEVLLHGNDARNLLAKSMFAGQLHFFFSADREWCETHLLPLLAWTDVRSAKACWDGYVMWGRWNDAMLRSGLLEHHLDAVKHAAELSEEKQRLLFERLAYISLQSEIDPLTWLDDFVANARVSDRVQWIQQVGWVMSRESHELNERRWAPLRSHWEKRLRGEPRPLTAEEAGELSEWPLHLEESIPEAVALATGHKSPLPQHGDFLHLLNERVENAPQAFGDLLAHVLTSTSSAPWSDHYLRQIVPKLRAHDVDVLPIVEQCLRLGFPDAPNW